MFERHEPVTVSAYDLLPEEDREALAWVREHGGLESVKRRLDWVVGHCSTEQQLDFDFWLSGRVMHELGFDGDMADRDEVEQRLLARLMPEGMEWLIEVWPKWSNGEYCKFGDWWMSDKYGESKPKQFRKLSIYTPEQLREWGQDDGDHFGYEWDFVRPANPKYRPDKVEPPAPNVLAADGEPLEVGQTVWSTNYGAEYVVCKVGQHSVTVEFWHEGIATHGVIAPSHLTNERPDSWERLEHDAEKTVCEYFGANYDCENCPLESARCAEEVKKDIIRRAKKLAERGA